MIRADEHNPHDACSEHFGEGTRTIADREYMVIIIPLQWNDGFRTAFIGVSITTILVYFKAGVLARVDANLQRILLLRRGLHDRPKWQDGSLLHQDWNSVEWGISPDCLSTAIGLTCPEINPAIRLYPAILIQVWGKSHFPKFLIYSPACKLPRSPRVV